MTSKLIQLPVLEYRCLKCPFICFECRQCNRTLRILMAHSCFDANFEQILHSTIGPQRLNNLLMPFYEDECRHILIAKDLVTALLTTNWDSFNTRQQATTFTSGVYWLDKLNWELLSSWWLDQNNRLKCVIFANSPDISARAAPTRENIRLEPRTVNY